MLSRIFSSAKNLNLQYIFPALVCARDFVAFFILLNVLVVGDYIGDIINPIINRIKIKMINMAKITEMINAVIAIHLFSIFFPELSATIERIIVRITIGRYSKAKGPAKSFRNVSVLDIR